MHLQRVDVGVRVSAVMTVISEWALGGPLFGEVFVREGN